MKRLLLLLLCTLFIPLALPAQNLGAPSFVFPGNNQFTVSNGNGAPAPACVSDAVYIQNDAPAGKQVWQCVNGKMVQQGGNSSQRVVYTSQLLGTTGDATVAAGSSTTGTDRAAALNAALSGGNVRLIVDGQYGLSTSLVLYSNTSVQCLRGMGFIMQAGSNAEVLVNKNPNNPTTSNGLGGYVVSNITDTNIGVQGCILNGNSTVAVTGSNINGVAHSVSPTSGLFVCGARFAGVSNLNFSDNEIYDSGAYGYAMSNVSQAIIERNYIHQPLPLVINKNTDGIHGTGPLDHIWERANRINAADDSISFNADDGNKTSSGDPNSPAASFPGFKWGNVTDVLIDADIIDGSVSGFRMYSDLSLIDRVLVNNLSGTCLEECGNITAQTSLGPGNVGRIRVAGWNLQSLQTHTEFGYRANFIVTSNVQSLELDGVQSTNAAGNWPIFQQTAGTINNLNFHDWNIFNSTGTSENLVVTSGASVGSIVASGFNWSDPASNTTAVFSGTAVPASLEFSGYYGPNRVLGSGYTPVIATGDAFLNKYNTVSTYLNTAFNEGASGATLFSTTPATETNTGATWALVGSAAYQYQAGGGVKHTDTGTGFATINVTPLNYVASYGLTSVGNSAELVVRGTDASNFIAVNISTPSTLVYDVVAGTATQIASLPTVSIPTSMAVTVNGNSITVSAPGVTAVTGTASSSNANGHLVGFSQYGASTGMIIGSLQVTSTTSSVVGGITDAVLGQSSAALKASASTQTFTSGLAAPSISLGLSSTALSRYAKYTATLSPAAVAANTCVAQSLTVPGIQAGDVLVAVQKPTEQTGLSIDPGHVSAANTATVNFCNNSAASITPTASQVYTFIVVQ